MDKSLQVRRQKAKARMRLRRRLEKGELRLEQVSIVASTLTCNRESPLILTKVRIRESELE